MNYNFLLTRRLGSAQVTTTGAIRLHSCVRSIVPQLAPQPEVGLLPVVSFSI